MAQSYAVQRVLAHYPHLSPEFVREKLWWSTYVNPDSNYMYYEAPKAGSTSLKMLIHDIELLPDPQPLIGSFREAKQEMFIHDRAQFGLPSLVDLDDATQERILTSPAVFRFTIVRNPFARLQSAWNEKVRCCEPGMEALYREIKGALPSGASSASIISFAEFVEWVAPQDLTTCDPHWGLQNRHLFHPAFAFSQVGRLEELGATVSLFLRHLGRDTGFKEPPRKNSSGASRQYTEKLAQTVFGLYQEDFDLFGYDRQSWQKFANEANGSEAAPNLVREDKYLADIIERNLMIIRLYDELDRLRAEKDFAP